MTKCDCCHRSFHWGELFKNILSYGSTHCKSCGCEHKITFPSRIAVTSMTVVPFMVFGLFLTPFKSNGLTIAVGLLIYVLGLMLTPFVANYKQASEQNV
ncbi:TIGR04104 family putative zinc finger protein [Halobacillus salinus]|uniref:TIGR04104 family putative zinc finger protein n=1 Tax=Halobacillus salinus TaxID=192814 RepID=UPI001590FF6B|nr:TIGR04104 family putative zinc finger protein [Halobacillus salinus]